MSALEHEEVLVRRGSRSGLLTAEAAQQLRCGAVAGPANNQLAGDEVAAILAARGILWAPDNVVNAGGAIYGVLRELHGQTHDAAMTQVGRIGETLAEIFAAARGESVTPHQAASRLARHRVAEAEAARGQPGSASASAATAARRS